MSAVDTTQAGASAAASPGLQQRLAASSERGGPGTGASKQAWLREMERAQTAGWFQPFNEAASAAGNGKTNEGAAPRPLAPSRSPMAFTPLTHRQYRTDSSVSEQQHQQQASPGSQEESDGLAETAQSVAADATYVDANGTTATARSRHSTLEDSPPEASVEGQDAATLESSSQPDFISTGVLGPRAALIRSEATSAVDPARPLVRAHVASFVPVVSQKASTLSAAIETVAQPQAPEGSQQRADDIDGPLNSSNVIKAVLTGQSSTRLHTAWTDEGLNLWLGMDGSAQQVNVQAALIANTLQQALKSNGQRLNRVICNGSVVFDASTSSISSPRDFSAELERHATSQQPVAPHSFPSQKETS